MKIRINVRILVVLMALLITPCFVQPMTCLKRGLNTMFMRCRHKMKHKKNLIDGNNRIIIYLSGVGSSGKSSIAKALFPMINGPTVIIDSDQTAFDIIRKKIYHEQPNRNVPASDAELCTYLISLYQQGLAQKFWDDVRRQMDDEVRRLHSGGNNVIIDGCISKKCALERYQKVYNDLPVFMVLVYCPIEQLFEHVMQRNSMDDIKEYRGLEGPFDGFFELYKNRAAKQEMQVDVLQKSSIEKVFEQIKQEVQRTIQDQNQLQQHLKVIDERMKARISQLGLDNNLAVLITPGFAHDMVVNTGLLSPEDCARQIANSLEIITKK